MIRRIAQVLQGSKSLNFKTLWGIFKKTLVLMRNEPMLWSPILRMVLLNFMFLGLLLTIIAFLFSKYNTSFGQVLTLGIILLVFILGRILYFGYLFGIVSAMVLLYSQNKPISFRAADVMVRGRIVSLAALNFLVQILSIFFGSEEGGDRARVLTALLGLFALESVDLLGHVLVPVIVTENVSLAAGVKALKDLRNHAPAGFAGIFALDMAQGLLSLLLYPGLVGIGLLGVLLGHLGLNFFPSNTAITLLNISFSWVPPVTGIMLLLLLWSAFIKPVFEGLKLIYFTLFYLMIRHKEEISPRIQTLLQTLMPNMA